MKVIVLGSCGAWPTEGAACSGFLVEHDGFRVLVDAGYATFPKLLAHAEPAAVDAVLITHGHPDHCADLNPLLRARYLAVAGPAPRLAVYAPRHALDAVLALDRPGMLDDAYELHEIEPGADKGFEVGPFAVQARLLPHWVPNLGFRLTADAGALAYTGDAGPDPAVAELAADTDLLIAEATHPEDADMSPDEAGYLTSAAQAARQAVAAGARALLLTHLWPGTDEQRALRAAAASGYAGELDVAREGAVVEL
ncbi:MAG TPA: MBL fold metallo-hydrolase [Actinospica sp.]|jgi:ribonuclease BN (tRNA processing enzyme)|nr:MBL fold metallo-hydrolase [Actinospica sp.]